jgi:hypothetical protein
MPSTTSPQYTYPYPYQAVFDATLAVLNSLSMRVTGADPATGAIVAKTTMSLTSNGENLEIRLWQPQPGFTGITVTSSLKFGIADPWGINQKNINKVFNALTPYLDTYLVAMRSPEPPPGG